MCWNLDRGGRGGNRDKPFSSECIAARNKKYKNALGRKRWNNGKIEIMTKEYPGDEWVLGRLPNVMCQWYNNGVTEVYTKECPSGFIRGKLTYATPKRKVYCVELKKEFESITEATMYFGKNHSHISDCCNGKREVWCGYHWKYVE